MSNGKAGHKAGDDTGIQENSSIQFNKPKPPCPISPALQAYLLNSSNHGLLMVHLLRNLLVVRVALGANVSLAKGIDDIPVRGHKVDTEGIRPGHDEER